MEDLEKAKQTALRLIAFRPRTVHELRNKLEEKGYSPEVVSDIVAFCQEYGYLDDARLARSWVKWRLNEKPSGKSLLIQELRAKGIDESIIENALSEEYNDRNEFDLAVNAVNKRLKSYQNLDRTVAERRILSFLSRRGFSFTVAREVTNEILDR